MKLNNVIFALVVALAAAMLHETEAKQYTVGGDLGWSILPGGAKTYASWASKHILNFHNDSLLFSFQTGKQDLVVVTEANFHSCNTKKPLYYFKNTIIVGSTGAGTLYFTCSFAGHCHKGQKVAVRFVSSPTGALGTAMSPSPAASAEHVTLDPRKITMNGW